MPTPPQAPSTSATPPSSSTRSGLPRAGLITGAVALVLVSALGAWLAWRSSEATSSAAAAAGRIEGRVSRAVADTPMPADAMVVVYAFAADGTGAPLAVWRRPASALPLKFTLDDSAAAAAGARLSAARTVVLGARLGPGGEPLAQVGDWLADSLTVAPGARNVSLTLRPPPK